MKSGIPWQVAGAGGEKASLGRGSRSAGRGQDPLGDDGGWRPGGVGPRRSAGHAGHRDAPTAEPPFGSVAPGTQVGWPEQPRPFEQVRARLLAELAKIRWTLQEAMPRSAVEALQGDLCRLGERAADSGRAGVERATVTAIERRLAEISDALRGLKPAESLLEAASVTRLLVRKIVSGATDPSALEQLEGAVAAMHGIASHVASDAALAKFSEDIRALGIALDDSRRRAGSRILAALDGRIAMLVDRPQAVDRRDPNAPDELKAAIERLVDRIEGMQFIPGGCPAHARLEELIAKVGETLDGCDARFDRLATLESTLVELLSHIGHRRLPTVAPERVPPLAVAALSRDVADLRQTGMETRDSLEIAHGTLAHVVDRLAMIETEMRGKPEQISAPSPLTCAGATASVPPAASEAVPLRLEHGTPPEQSVADHHGTQADVPSDRPQGPDPGTAHDPDSKSSGERVLFPETALMRATPPLPEDFAGTSTFIAAARRAAQAASGGHLTKNGAAPSEFTDHDAPARRPGKLGALISGVIIIMALGALQGLGFLLPSPREAEVGAPPRTAATSTEDVAPPPVPSPTPGPVLASQSRGTFTALSPARPQVDIFRYIDGANIVTPAPGSAIADWTLEQLLEAQMTPERWDDATGGIAVSVPAPFRRKLPPDFGTFHRAQ
jgi:localization factor PodJL